MIGLTRAAVLCMAGTIAGLAQQAAPNSDPVIRVTVDLVQVDAVVTDSQGHHVPDLKAEDFRILEDGKPQTITHFLYVPGNKIDHNAVPAVVAPQSPATGQSQLAPPTPRALRPEEVRRTVVMIADDLGLSSDDVPAVRKAMKNFVDREMQPGDLLSIMTTSGGMGAFEQLSNDKRQLYASIEHIHWRFNRTALTWYEPVKCCDAPSKVEVDANRRVAAVRSPFLVVGTMGTMASAIAGLSRMPGRKAIALFSDGFSGSVQSIVELANRASVVIYTFDPRGMVNFFLTAVDDCRKCNVRFEETRRQTIYRASQASLSEMARGTGGIFFHDNNDLSQGLSQAMDDIGGYYLIGYQPKREDFEKPDGKPQFHRTAVKVLRSGLNVRSRSGFFGVPDAAPSTQPASAKEALHDALFSAFGANGFPVHLSAFYSAGSEKDVKTGRHPILLRAMLGMDARQIEFREAPESGKQQMDLEIVAAAFGAGNEVVASTDRTFSTAMTAEEMKDLAGSGLVYALGIEVPKAGPYQVRVAVRDANSGRAGSAATVVDIPNFNGTELTLSSILLSDTDKLRNEALTRTGVVGAGTSVMRVFGAGAVMTYDCGVFGAVTDARTGLPNLEAEVRLFRGWEQIFAGKPMPVTVAEGSKPPFRSAGEIKLPSTLPPGDYAMELIVSDRLAKGARQQARQTVDFSLANQALQ